MIQVKKIDKTKLNSRTKTSIIVAAYYVLIFIFSFFADPRSKYGGGWNWWMGQHDGQIVSYTFAILLTFALAFPLYFIAKELNSCFLKTNKKYDTILITVLLFLMQIVPFLIYLPLSFSNMHWTTTPQNLTYIFIASSFLLPIISYFWLQTIIVKSPNKTPFNIFWFPLFTIFIGWSMQWFQYLALIRYWTTILLIVACVASTDVFAYIFGSMFGKHQLTKISPKKTWEGAIFGVVCSTLLVLLFLYIFSFSPTEIYEKTGYLSSGDSSQGSFIGIQIGTHTKVGGKSWRWWIICTFVIISMSVVSIFGDLFFSWLKRKNNIKDFSGLLKDHGGILDRVDSLILTITFFGLITTLVAFACTYNDQVSLVFPTFLSN